MLAEGSHLQCLNHKPRKNWSPTGHPWLCPSLWSESPKISRDPTSQRISSTQDLTVVSFSLLYLGTLFMQHMSWANCWFARKKSCGIWLQKWCQVLQACLIFKRPSFPNLEKNIYQKVPRFPTKTQKRFTKNSPSKCSKMHWPSVMKGSVHQAFLHLKFPKGFGVLWSVSCVTYRWHPSQTRMR